jgi:hypothetical protein
MRGSFRHIGGDGPLGDLSAPMRSSKTLVFVRRICFCRSASHDDAPYAYPG